MNDIYVVGCVFLMIGTSLQAWDHVADVVRGLRFGRKSGVTDSEFNVGMTWLMLSVGATLVALDAAGMTKWWLIIIGLLISLAATFIFRRVFFAAAKD